ncbi:type II toxin-antitoxin system HipA family toxin [Treponema bryantii]|uniref:type II toxin-antitoxin system HipA family toxin n=1 Tax=Treponema bryantii TaxID=163 RepID=UPI0003B31D48|nr:type II toxin-antitoxin system HipA family toxin [Treponema bryantii]
MISTALVKLWGTVIGAVSLDDTKRSTAFEYDSSFLSSGIEVSPIVMPLKKGVYTFPSLSYESFHGLPGLLSDSLPDKFGNELINVWLAKQGRLPESFNAVERLCYTGTRGMGALEYEPAVSSLVEESSQIQVSELVELASMVLSNRKNLKVVLEECDKKRLSESLKHIISMGTSAGGARAKALIAWNPKTNEVRSGQIETNSDFEYWLMKFSGVSGNKDKEDEDLADFGMIEYAYYLMAIDCGINMMHCRLLNDGKNHHFMTKRFDRTAEGKKLHMQSLAAIGHFDFNAAGTTSYEQCFTILNTLGLGHHEKLDMFRRMVFNVAACNCDDHVKNISFLMDKSGKWTLAPAYDVSFAYNPDGAWTSSHQMSINGKRKNIAASDFDTCARIAGLKNAEAKAVVSEVCTSLSHWKEFAATAGVTGERAEAIAGLQGIK